MYVPRALLMGFLPKLPPQAADAVPRTPAERTSQSGQSFLFLLSILHGHSLAGGVLHAFKLTPAPTPIQQA